MYEIQLSYLRTQQLHMSTSLETKGLLSTASPLPLWAGKGTRKLMQPCQANRQHLTNQGQHHTCGTALLPNIPFSTAMQRPIMTSSLTFSMMAAASPATRASRTGALYRFQNKNSSPRLAVVLPTCPNRLALGSQKTRSKQRTTCQQEEEV